MARATRWIPRLAAALLTLALLAPSALADDWDKRGEDCDKTAFKKPLEVDLKKLARCVRLFEAYHSGQELKKSEQKRVLTAMRRLHEQGNDLDAHIARLGLKRFQVMVKPRDRKAIAGGPTGLPSVAPGKKAPGKKKHVAFSTCPGGSEPASPDKKAVKKAKKLLKSGLKAYKKEDYEGALKEFEEMLEVAPGYPSSLYNVATMSAKTGKDKRALDMLQCLKDMATDDALRLVKKSRVDEDFMSLRINDDFKLLTGYAKILVLDSLPEGRGEDNVDNLMATLEKLKYDAYGPKVDNKERTAPFIWYRWTNKVQAYVFTKVIDHPRTSVQLMPPALEKRGYDIVIVWGDRYKKDEDPPIRIKDPEDAEKTLDDIARTEDEILKSPDKYTGEVDETLGRAEKNIKKVEDVMNAPDKAMDKAGKTVDKVKGWGDKVGF